MTKSTGAAFWQLERRIPVVRSKSIAGLWLTVGPKMVAVSDYVALRLILSREQLSPIWTGCVSMAVIEWADATRLSVRTGQRRSTVGVWDLRKGDFLWKMKGIGAAWREAIAVANPSGDLAVKEVQSGKKLAQFTVSAGTTNSMLVVGDTLLHVVDDELYGIDLVSRREVWQRSLGNAFSGLPLEGVRLRTLLEADVGHAILRYYSCYARIHAQSGRVIWKRSVATNHLPAISETRVGFLYSGHVLLLDLRSGAIVAAKKAALETFWEARPCAIGDVMVAVDQTGRIATVRLSDGRVLGLQQERVPGFGHCEAVDGRLLVVGHDGAIWVYERAKAGGAAAEGTASKRLASAKARQASKLLRR